MQCENLYDLMPDFVDLSALPADADKHVSNCLRCQAEMAHYRSIRRSLSEMKSSMVAPPTDLLSDILSAVRPDADVVRIDKKSRRRKVVGGIAAAVTAGAGVAIYAAKFAHKHKIAS